MHYLYAYYFYVMTNNIINHVHIYAVWWRPDVDIVYYWFYIKTTYERKKYLYDSAQPAAHK